MPRREEVHASANRYSFFLKRRTKLERWAVARTFELRDPIDPEGIRRAAQTLIRNHDGIRMQVDVTTRFRQYTVAPEDIDPLEIVPVAPGSSDEGVLHLISGHVTRIVSKFAFPGQLFRIILFQRPADEDVSLLVFVCHHILVDAWSWSILLRDFFAAYEAISCGREVRLPEKVTSLAKLFSGSESFWNDNRDRADKYWFALAWNLVRPLPTLPSADETDNTECKTVTLSRLFSAGSDKSAMGASIKDIATVLVAIARAYCEWTKHDAICIGLVTHGREVFDRSIDPTNVVGWISETVPVVIENIEDSNTMLRAVIRQIMAVQTMGKSFGILRYLNEGENNGYMSLPEPEISLNVKLNRLDNGDFIVAKKSEQFQVRVADVLSFREAVARPFLLSGGLLKKNSWMELRWDFSTAMLSQGEVKTFMCRCITEYEDLRAEKNPDCRPPE